MLSDGPTAYWRLGEASGTVADDEASTNNGTYQNGVTLGQTGALLADANTAASFDGVNDIVSVPHSSSLNATTGVTIEAWVKRSKTGAWQNILGKPGNGGNAAQNYALWLNPPTSPSRSSATAATATPPSASTAPAIDTNWHHVAATYDEATARVYVDGVLRASTNSNIQLTANSQPLLIGRTTDNVRIFGGTLDEVAVYPTALSAARIQAHYTAATSVDTTPPAVTLTTPSDGSVVGPTPNFSGAAGNASGDLSTVTLRIYSGNTTSGQLVQTRTTSASAGSWSVNASPALADGIYTAQARQADSVGNVGLSAPATFTVTSADITPPAVTITTPPNGSSGADTTPLYTGGAGTAPGDLPTITVNVYLGLTPSGQPLQTYTTSEAGGSWSVQGDTLPDGAYTIRAEQDDAAGNLGLSTPHTFTVGTSYRDDVLSDNPAGYWRLGEASGNGRGQRARSDEQRQLRERRSPRSDGRTHRRLEHRCRLRRGQRHRHRSALERPKRDYRRHHPGVGQALQDRRLAEHPRQARKRRQRRPELRPLAEHDQPAGRTLRQRHDLRRHLLPPPSTRTGTTSWRPTTRRPPRCTSTASSEPPPTRTSSSQTNTQPLLIGRTSDNLRIFGGILDEVAVYPTALSAARIQSHYQKGTAADPVPPVVTLSTPPNGSTTLDTRPHFAGVAEVTASDSSTVTVKIYAGSSATGTPVQTLDDDTLHERDVVGRRLLRARSRHVYGTG